MISALPEADTFVKDFTVHALRTVRLVQLFEDKDLGLRPGEGSMSTAEQVNHICASNNFVRGLLEEPEVKNDWFNRAYDVSTAAAAVKSLTTAIREVQAAAAKVTPELWDEEVAPWGPDWRMTRSKLLHLMLEHEVHHTGQLHVYARMAGKVPPMLYLPVDESILQ